MEHHRGIAHHLLILSTQQVPAPTPQKNISQQEPLTISYKPLEQVRTSYRILDFIRMMSPQRKVVLPSCGPHKENNHNKHYYITIYSDRTHSNRCGKLSLQRWSLQSWFPTAMFPRNWTPQRRASRQTRRDITLLWTLC